MQLAAVEISQIMLPLVVVVVHSFGLGITNFSLLPEEVVVHQDSTTPSQARIQRLMEILPKTNQMQE